MCCVSQQPHQSIFFEAILSGPRLIKQKWMLAVRERIVGGARLQMCLDAIYQFNADLKALIMM